MASFHSLDLARLCVAALLVLIAAPLGAQVMPAEAIAFGDGRVTIGGDISAAYSCSDSPDPDTCGADTGFFNYSDYEHSTLRMVRMSLNAAVRATRQISLLTDVRSENGEAPQPYALYLRIRPWQAVPLDIQVGRVPPTFGSFGRRSYPSDNLVIGYPLQYQYLTSLRTDAMPASIDELFTMRGRGWLSTFSIGNRAPDRGLPLATAFHWDTGVQVHAAAPWIEGTASVTTGSLADPRGFDDNNNGRQLAGRVALHPATGLQIGASASRGAFLTNDAAAAANVSSRDFPQSAVGADIEYSRDYYLLRAETIWSTFRLPTIDPALHSLGLTVEGRYKVHPGWYVAGRFDHLGFNELTGTRRTTSWDAPVTRGEVAAAYRIQRNLELKTSLQHNSRPAGRVHHSNILSAQVSAWF